MRTTNRTRHQELPREWAEREALRGKGQFWTPPWVAEAMVAYAIGGGATEVFDPAVGAGAFFTAAKSLMSKFGHVLTLKGTEVDGSALEAAREAGLAEDDLEGVETRDFVLDPPSGPFSAIVANPPYIRHHRLADQTKMRLRSFATGLLGHQLDGRAGYHVYFLLRALTLLEVGGRLAFIMPADTCEGVFARGLWDWITRHYCLEAVVTFAPQATPFPGIDTNALIFMLSRRTPNKHFLWARCERAETPDLFGWCKTGLKEIALGEVSVNRRELSEGLGTGFSRPSQAAAGGGPILLDYAQVVRGIATGDNEFFLLNSQRVTELGIPEQYFKRAIARTRDVEGDEITCERLGHLDSSGRPTFLLSLGREPIESLPAPLQAYLHLGEGDGIPARPLVATRRPWYRMEVRKTPPLLFAYLGRRRARFILNRAGVVPLTGFLCVYPRSNSREFVDKLWCVLKDPRTVANLVLVGKSYGGGAIKVEPRALEKLPIPAGLLLEFDLRAEPSQLRLLA